MGSKMWADEYPQGAGRICNAPSSRTAALGIGPYKHPGTLLENLRDCHASDIGHWLAMTPIFWADGVVHPYKVYPQNAAPGSYQARRGWSWRPSRAAAMVSGRSSKCATMERGFLAALSCEKGTK